MARGSLMCDATALRNDESARPREYQTTNNHTQPLFVPYFTSRNLSVPRFLCPSFPYIMTQLPLHR